MSAHASILRMNPAAMTFQSVLLAAVKLPTGVTARRVRMELAAAQRRVEEINAVFAAVLPLCGVPGFRPVQVRLPPFAGDIDHAAIRRSFGNWAAEIETQLPGDRIGLVTWHEPRRCTLEFVDATLQRGLLANARNYRRHVHALINARVHQATHPEVALPRQAAAILRLMGGLLPHVSILTGTQVEEGQLPLDTVHELTLLGRVVDLSVQAVGQGVRAVEGAEKGVVPVVAMLAVLAADPGLCVGNRVFYGWRDEGIPAV